MEKKKNPKKDFCNFSRNYRQGFLLLEETS